MNEPTIEVDICYNDYFIEVYTVEHQELKYLIQTLADEECKNFNIGDKSFMKRDLNSVSIANHGLGFIFMDVKD